MNKKKKKNPFNKATLNQNNFENPETESREKVYYKPIRNWKSVLKPKAVRENKRKPSMRLLSKTQRIALQKRAKMKKMAHRRK